MAMTECVFCGRNVRPPHGTTEAELEKTRLRRAACRSAVCSQRRNARRAQRAARKANRANRNR